MQLPVSWARTVAVLAIAGTAACSDQGGGLTAPSDVSRSTALVPGIVIGVDSNPVTVARGASATVNVRVARIAGFTGAVTLSVDTAGVARGVRATIANATIAANDTVTRAVTITVDTSATASTSDARPAAAVPVCRDRTTAVGSGPCQTSLRAAGPSVLRPSPSTRAAEGALECASACESPDEALRVSPREALREWPGEAGESPSEAAREARTDRGTSTRKEA